MIFLSFLSVFVEFSILLCCIFFILGLLDVLMFLVCGFPCLFFVRHLFYVCCLLCYLSLLFYNMFIFVRKHDEEKELLVSVAENLVQKDIMHYLPSV